MENLHFKWENYGMILEPLWDDLLEGNLTWLAGKITILSGKLMEHLKFLRGQSGRTV